MEWSQAIKLGPLGVEAFNINMFHCKSDVLEGAWDVEGPRIESQSEHQLELIVCSVNPVNGTI